MKTRSTARVTLSFLLLCVFALVPQVQAQAPPKAEAKKPQRRPVPRLKVGTFELSQKPARQPGTVAAPFGATVGASRGIVAAAVVPLAPRLGRSYGLAPRLFWRMPAFINRVTVRLFDSEMNRWEWQVNGTEFQIPAGELALHAGATYSWQLESPVGHVSDIHEFVIVSGEERKQVEERLARFGPADTPERRLEQARLFAELGLWYDVVEAYTNLIQEFPNRPDLYEERAQVLGQLPATKPESEEDLRKAGTLLTAPPG